MELDELKTGIRSRLEEGIAASSATGMTRVPKSHSPLANIRRSLRIEIFMTVLLSAAYIVLGFLSDDRPLKVYLLSLTLLFGAVTIPVYSSLHRMIDRVIRSTPTVRDSVSALLAVLKRYRRLSIYFTLFIIPFCMVYSKLLYDHLPSSPDAVDALATGRPDIGWFELFAVSAVLMALFYLLMRLYYKWMYDRHIRELESTLADFGDLEEA
jgi:hypothetical protein